jgi:hypothetical protein
MTPIRRFKTIALAGAALVLAAAAAEAQPQSAAKPAPQKSSSRECFLVRDVDGFNAPDDHTVYIRVGVSQIYRLDLMMDCLNLTFRQSLGIEHTSGEPWICSPLDAEIVYRDVGMPQRCPVTAIHKLTPDEAAALPKKNRP